jgi:hypothetical protein
MKSLKTVALLAFCSLLLFSCKKDDAPPPPKPPVAEAGNNQNIQLPASSFTLTGSGTTTNGNITGYLWSLVSGPNVPVIASPSSASTSVTGFVAGTYVFQFLVRDDAGLTDVDTTTVTVTPSPIQTLTLQPSNNADERHIWGNSTTDQSTHAPELDAGTWTSGGDVVYIRGLLKFDLSSIPANATILTANLSLYSNPTPLNGDLVHANSGTDNSMFIRRVTSDWVPANTNWLNQPSTTTTDQVSIPHTSMAFLDLVDIDVKNLVVAMQSSGNYGFMISLQNEVTYNLRDFCSSTYSDATKHPKLVVTYQ